MASDFDQDTDMDVEMIDIDGQIEDETCHFFKLPRELRDMIWVLACAGNTYSTAGFTNEKLKFIIFPLPTSSPRNIKPTRRDHFTAQYLPNTLVSGQAVNKQIFHESVPILIRNTTFILQSPTDFEKLVACYTPIRPSITSAQIHFAGRKMRPFNVFSIMAVRSCPRLTSLIWDAGEVEMLSWIKWHFYYVRGKTQLALGNELTVRRLKSLRGISEFKLLAPDIPAKYSDRRLVFLREQLVKFLEKEIADCVKLPRDRIPKEKDIVADSWSFEELRP